MCVCVSEYPLCLYGSMCECVYVCVNGSALGYHIIVFSLSLLVET